MGVKYNPFAGNLDIVDSPSGDFTDLDVSGDITLDDGGTYTTTVQVVTPTANRTISFPDATGTVALVAGSSGQVTYNDAGAQAGLTSANIGSTGEINISLAGAASTPPVSFTGSWFTGGTSTTTKPQLLIEPTGTTSTAWSTSGTGLGVNAASGFAGNLIDLQINGSSKALVDSSGRLLVGTSSAESNYYISTVAYTPGIQFKGSDYNPSLSLNRTNGGAFAFLTNSENVTTSGRAFGGISFNGNDGAKYLAGARISAEADGTTGTDDMPGRLVFSTTADSESSPTEHVRIDRRGQTVVWSTSAPMLWGRNETDGNVTGLAYYNTATSTTSLTGQVFRVMCDGDVENTNNAYGAISDLKLKENIVNANSQWDDLKALQVRNYNFKPETGYSTHTQIGLIAQEVELVSPGLVGESIDEETGESTKSVNYSVLYMKAVKALQEAMERIETLEQRLSDAGIA